MERIKLRHDSATKACRSLKAVLDILEAEKNSLDEDHAKIYRDSLIQRFEFSYDILWKHLKDYLKHIHGVEVTSPKTVFKECLNQKICNEEETKLLLNMLEDRNLTTHLYSEKMADEISQRIKGYHVLIGKLLEKTKYEN